MWQFCFIATEATCGRINLQQMLRQSRIMAQSHSVAWMPLNDSTHLWTLRSSKDALRDHGLIACLERALELRRNLLADSM